MLLNLRVQFFVNFFEEGVQAVKPGMAGRNKTTLFMLGIVVGFGV